MSLKSDLEASDLLRAKSTATGFARSKQDWLAARNERMKTRRDLIAERRRQLDLGVARQVARENRERIRSILDARNEEQMLRDLSLGATKGHREALLSRLGSAQSMIGGRSTPTGGLKAKEAHVCPVPPPVKFAPAAPLSGTFVSLAEESRKREESAQSSRLC